MQQQAREGGSASAGTAPASLDIRARFARRLAESSSDRARLHRYTALATQLLNAPSAQVSIIADAQVVLAGSGSAEHDVDKESPAGDSLCTVTIGSGGVLQVSDAPNDAAVSHLPPVTSGAVGAYLGAPLLVGGHLVGALCVYGESPREWTDQDASVLEVLAEAVASELQSSALQADYANDREVWQLAVDAAGVGSFDWNLRTGELRWDDQLHTIFGTTPDAFGGTIDAFSSLVHPEDRDRVETAIAASIDQCGEFMAEYRIIPPGAAGRWVSARGRALAGSDGSAARLIGVAFDSTALQEGEARVARILEAMPSAFFHLDREWRFTYANAEAQRLLGGVSVDVVGANIWDLFAAAPGTVFEARYRRAMHTGSPEFFEAYYPPPLDSWYEVRAWPSPDGLSVYFQDITSRKLAEERLALIAERSALLSEVTASLTGTVDTLDAVGRLAQLLAPRLGQWCLVSLIDDPDPFERRNWRYHVRDIAGWHSDPGMRPVLQRYSRVRLPALTDSSYLAKALRDGATTVLSGDATEAIATHLDPGEARTLHHQLAPAHVVILPIHGRGRTVGALTLARDAHQPPFSADDVVTLAEIAARGGLVLDNTLLFGRQRDLAEGLQRRLLTPPPQVEGFDVAVRYAPAAEMAQVGGDWHDAFETPDGMVLVIGDVMGHDTAAAADMGQLRAMTRGIAVTTKTSPAGLLTHLDNAMATLRVESTASAVVARLTGTAGTAGPVELQWSCAGHPPPVLAWTDGDGRARTHLLRAEMPDTLLGITPTEQRTESTALLPPGSVLLLYTDGLVERRDQPLDIGLSRLVGVVEDAVSRCLAPEELADELLRRLLPARPEDDVAVIVVRTRTSSSPPSPSAGVHAS